MNKIFLYIATAITAVGMTSCLDILDQEPLDSYTDDAVWSDLALSETYLNAQYMNLWAENMKGTRFAHYTDEVYQKHTYGSENVTQGLLSCDNPAIGWDDTMWDPWYSYYQYISKINLFLERIDDVPGDEEYRNHQKGQGLFLRAWNYHMLYSLFGRVPIVDHTYSLDATFDKTRQDLDVVADFIIRDCDAAAELLPLEYSKGKDFGRATKGAALALKSRVLLYKASPLFGTPSNEKWKAAANAAKDVMELGKYYLKSVSSSDEYSALFYDERNPEAIFMKLYDPKYGSGSNMSFLYQAPCGIGNGFQGWGNFNPTQNIVDKFQMADGTDPELKTYYDTYPWYGREIRFYSAFILDGDEWGYAADKREVEIYFGADGLPNGKDSGGGEYWWNASNTGYSMRKFMDPSYDSNSTTMHTSPWFFMRLSEIYLNYAECQIELGNTGEALEYINKVRTRALLPDATGENIRKEYEYERQMELVFEGQRWFDLRRWKRMTEEYSKPIYGVSIWKYLNEDGTTVKRYWTDNVISTRVFNNEKLYWVPVPRWELNRSKLIDGAPYE